MDRPDRFDEALRLVSESRKASCSYLQRKMQARWSEVAGYIECMERDGMVSGPDYLGRREVLIEQIGQATNV